MNGRMPSRVKYPALYVSSSANIFRHAEFMASRLFCYSPHYCSAIERLSNRKPVEGFRKQGVSKVKRSFEKIKEKKRRNDKTIER